MANDESMLQLGYRALFHVEDVDGGEELVGTLDTEFRSWARTLVEDGSPLSTWDGVSKLQLKDKITVEGAQEDGGKSGIFRRMYRLDNRSHGKLFRIDAYAIGHRDPNEEQLILVEGLMEAPDRDEAAEQFGTPRLVRSFVGEHRALVGDARLTDAPQPAVAGMEADVYEEIMDPKRSVPITVAVSPAREANEKWTELIGNLVRNSVGMSLTWTVPFDSADRLNDLLPPGFQVRPGMARTFLPEIDLDDPKEYLRHRSIGSQALSEAIVPRNGELRLQHHLLRSHARGVRRNALAAPLPKEVRRSVALTKRSLAQLQRTERVQEVVAAAPTVVTEPVSGPPESTAPTPEPLGAPVLPPGMRRGLEQIRHLAAVGRAVFGYFTGRLGDKAIGLDPVEEIDKTYQKLEEKTTEVDAVWKAYGEDSDHLED